MAGNKKKQVNFSIEQRSEMKIYSERDKQFYFEFEKKQVTGIILYLSIF